MTMPFLNASYLADGDQRRRAEGLRLKGENLPKDGIPQSGGMSIDATKPIEEETLLVRFSHQSREGRVLDVADHLNSPWWLTKDLFEWLMMRARSSSRGVIEIVREQLFLPEEWNGANCIVQAFPKPGIRLGVWFGRPKTVEAEDEGPSRRWVAAREAPLTWMYQIYVPGLNPAQPLNALKWMEFEGLYGIHPVLSRRGQPLLPCIRPGRVHGG